MLTAIQMKMIRADADAALSAVAAKHGLTKLSLGKGKYGADNFEFKLEGVIAGGLAPEAQRYESNRAYLDLPVLGTTFDHAGRRYKTVGLNTTGTKVLCTEHFTGKTYLFHTHHVKRIA